MGLSGLVYHACGSPCHAGGRQSAKWERGELLGEPGSPCGTHSCIPGIWASEPALHDHTLLLGEGSPSGKH